LDCFNSELTSETMHRCEMGDQLSQSLYIHKT